MPCVDMHPAYADVLVQATGANGVGYGNPQLALNGAYGGGLYKGSTDVFSLDKAADGALVASWSVGTVCDGAGADFVVFENAFREKISKALFFEPIVVSVSLDGVNFIDFPHTYLGTQKLGDVVNEKNWVGFAGMTPVLYNEATNSFDVQGINPLDVTVAGGDAFDLQDLPDTDLGSQIKAEGFKFVKLTAAPALGFPNSPNSFGGYADVDGIYAARFLTP